MLSESNLKGEEMCDSWRRTTHPALGYLQQCAESDAKRNESGGAHMVDEESSNASKREDIGLRVHETFSHGLQPLRALLDHRAARMRILHAGVTMGALLEMVLGSPTQNVV
jgi:hypothetical protein